MEEDLTAAMLAYAGIKALVKSRIQWLVRPQGALLPAIVLQKVSAPRAYTLQGRVGLVGHLVQASCWGRTFLEAKGVSRAVLLLADTLTTAPFQGVFAENERDTVETGAPLPDGAEDYYRTDLDLRVWHFSAA